MMLTQPRWTNASVRMLAGSGDPIEAITRKARGVVLAAMDPYLGAEQVLTDRATRQ